MALQLSKDNRKSAHERGYNARWHKARKTYLMDHPLCAMCAARGRVTAATVVDHKQPHRGDQKLFWALENWQALCATCHNSHKQSLEKGGAGRYGCGLDGHPIDPNHHWNHT